MFTRLIAVATLALLVAVPAHGAAKPTLPPPSGLRAFLLRADEPRTDTYARTPSFAWAPYSGTLVSYMQQMISQQGDAASNADSLNQGQQVVVNSLQQRFSDQSSVNIDEEMSNLLKLQTAYGANARVLSAVRDMLDQLLKS